jgi:hypothetical protein
VACTLVSACGSGASSAFGTDDAGPGFDALRGIDTGTLGGGRDSGHKDSTTGILSSPDTGTGGKDGSCATAITCASAGAKCGTISNGCGGIAECGTCPTTQTCGGGGKPNQCGTKCVAQTCAEQGFTCGAQGDGCGGTLDCGGCDGGTCGGGGTPNQCGAMSTCTPTTCTALGFTCGSQGDGCGGTLDCGTCVAPQTCGGGGTPSVCGAPVCVPKTCADLGFTCGPASDGCNNTLECGSCTTPQACGGGGGPGVCGCTGTCAELPNCPGTTTTTITGKVYDPGDVHPLYDVLVYVPNNPADPALTAPFAAGISCEQCGANAAGDPLVTTNTAPDGSFTLSGVPVSSSLPLVIELGRWRRQFTVDVASSCGTNPVTTTSTKPVKWLAATAPALAASGHLTMPTSSTYGDIPRIAILTGGWDPMECVLRKMGVADSEFVNPGGAGHIQFYTAAEPALPANPFQVEPAKCPPNPYGSGAVISGATPTQASLFAATGGPGGTPELNNYDVAILACEGYEVNNTANWASLGAYAGAGGRVLASDFGYDWLAETNNTCEAGPCTGTEITQNPAFPNVATWATFGSTDAVDGTTETATVDLVSNPKGPDFQSWLQDISIVAAGADTVSLNPVFQATNAIVAPTQQWLHWGTATPIQFTFNTPVGAAATAQCGRVNFMDWHADELSYQPVANYPQCPYTWTGGAPYFSHGMTFPTECDSGPMTAQEAVLEFMLFDVASCVTPYQATCTSVSCAQQGISCGPAGDGCGNLLQCGTCPAGETCGGGGTPSVCGAPQCTPTSCAAQGIHCGPAGDGCGNLLQCGTCPTGQTCGGGGTPGVCGAGTCTPETCSAQDIACGPAGDGCGNTLNCGTCPAGESCGGGGKSGQCGSSCTPKTCTQLGYNCGAAGDGCGNEIQCGTCTGGDTCGGGGTAGVCGTGGGPK